YVYTVWRGRRSERCSRQTAEMSAAALPPTRRSERCSRQTAEMSAAALPPTRRSERCSRQPAEMSAAALPPTTNTSYCCQFIEKLRVPHGCFPQAGHFRVGAFDQGVFVRRVC